MQQISDCEFCNRFLCIILTYVYRNNPKFLDRQVWANSVDPDQTAPRGAVSSGSALLAIPFAYEPRHDKTNKVSVHPHEESLGP